MPITLIEVRKQYSKEECRTLIDAVYGALRSALKLPEWDRTVRLVMHDPDLFVCPPDKSSPALYTLVTINMFAGRSIQVKRDLYRTIVGNLESCGIPKDHVVINLIEIANENWGIQGGKPASEVDIGFKVEI